MATEILSCSLRVNMR